MICLLSLPKIKIIAYIIISPSKINLQEKISIDESIYVIAKNSQAIIDKTGHLPTTIPLNYILFELSSSKPKLQFFSHKKVTVYRHDETYDMNEDQPMSRLHPQNTDPNCENIH